MTEDEARNRIAEAVPRETLQKLDRLSLLLTGENERQNLVAPSTIPIVWARHMLDSAQLVWRARGAAGPWLDIGSGGGFPGLVVALLFEERVFLAEPRTKRAIFLQEAAAELGLTSRVTVFASKVETAALPSAAGVISARAVAPLPALFQMALRHSTSDTLWLLPKGRSAADEVAQAQREWQGEMRREPSLSDPDSEIVIARGLKRIGA